METFKRYTLLGDIFPDAQTDSPDHRRACGVGEVQPRAEVAGCPPARAGEGRST
jgi:hypothetical protein